MTVLLIILHIVISLFLILVVLVQQGKGADLAGAFGGGGSQTAFGARGATTLLHKLTTGFFIAFVLTSLALGILQGRPRGSVMAGQAAAPATTTTSTTTTSAPAPAAPAPATPAPAAPATQ
jgi:preprotein translocase subunit SecG